jgi:hypothetical protein
MAFSKTRSDLAFSTIMDVRQTGQRPSTIETMPDRPRAKNAAVDVDLVNRVRAEFAEMRGFSPTLIQAARLFDLAPAECRRVLERLVDERVLQQTPDGCYRLLAE